VSDDMQEWPEHERRREIHVTCAKEGEWGDLKATLRGILESQKRMERKQELAFIKNHGRQKQTGFKKSLVVARWS